MDLKISDSALRPPARDMIFKGSINHPDAFIWDAWSLTKDGTIFLYALASPRDVYKDGTIDIQTQRDHIPHHHRLFISTDQGKSWKDGGPVFAPRLGEDKFDSRSIWTGSTVHFQGKIIGGYTGIRMTDESHPFIQSIGLSVSDDGKIYTRLTSEPLSCPIRDYDEIRAKGYFLGERNDLGTDKGENGQNILAWRDPGLVVDPATGLLHAFWSAKTDKTEEQEAALAHGIIHDPLTKPRLELLAPAHLPDHAEFTQAEVPQLIYSKAAKLFYMVVSTTNRTSGDQTDGDLDLAARLYSSPELGGKWTFVGKVLSKDDKRYPATIVDFVDTDKGGVLYFTAPFNRSNAEDIMHTMPPINAALVTANGVTRLSGPDADMPAAAA